MRRHGTVLAKQPLSTRPTDRLIRTFYHNANLQLPIQQLQWGKYLVRHAEKA